MNGVVFDIGGTNLRVGLTNGKKLNRTLLVPAPRTFSEFVESLVTTGRKLTGKKKITAVAGGIAGPLDKYKTTLARSKHLKFLVRKPIRATLQRRFHAPVTLENDNALVGLGEATHGAGRGEDIVAYIGIGTGIGGVRIVDGHIDRNALGFEPGHHFLKHDVTNHNHVSAHPGDWESLVSGTGMEARYGKKAEAIRNRKVWNEMASLTAYGLINVAMFWSPNVIVVGGSFVKSLSLPLVRQYAEQYQKIFPRMPRIVKGTLGDFGGLYGAMQLLRKRG